MLFHLLFLIYDNFVIKVKKVYSTPIAGKINRLTFRYLFFHIHLKVRTRLHQPPNVALDRVRFIHFYR